MNHAHPIGPIRVCFVMPKAYPLFNPALPALFGGSEVDLYYLATELARNPDFAVSFVVADYGQPDREVREGVTLIKSLRLRQNALAGAARLWRALERADADFYLTKTFSPGVPLIAWFCRRRQRRFAYRSANEHEYDGRYLRDHPLLGRAFAWALRRAEVLFAQNAQDGENLRGTLGIAAEVIPNGHRLPQLTNAARHHILWVGRSAEIKRPREFLALAGAYPAESFVMICPRATGAPGYQRLRAAARGAHNLEFIEHVPFHQVQRYFDQAKMLVNTSDAEGFANTFIQAGAAATPILSLRVNPDGFLDRHGCGLCAGGDWQVFRRHFERLLDPAVAADLGRRARDYVEQHHDIAALIQRYQEVFRRHHDHSRPAHH